MCELLTRETDGSFILAVCVTNSLKVAQAKRLCDGITGRGTGNVLVILEQAWLGLALRDS